MTELERGLIAALTSSIEPGEIYLDVLDMMREWLEEEGIPKDHRAWSCLNKRESHCFLFTGLNQTAPMVDACGSANRTLKLLREKQKRGKSNANRK